LRYRLDFEFWQTPLIHFLGSNMQPKIQLNTFGCPVYAPNNYLA
jgi:hypothetical protein